MAPKHSSSRAQDSAGTLPDMDHHRPRDLRVVFASTGCTDVKVVHELLPRIVDLPNVSVRAVLDTGFRGQDFIQASACCLTVPNAARRSAVRDVAEVEQEAAELCVWADLLVLAPIDANNLAKMLHGHTDSLLLELLRSWNVSKKILLVPGMSALMWEHPMTKKQLSKIRRKWNWVQVLPEMLWTFEGDEKKVHTWEAMSDLVDAIRNQVDLMNIGSGLRIAPHHRSFLTSSASPLNQTQTSAGLLPAELWSMIFDCVGDWELAQTLHIFTNLTPPLEWSSHTNPEGPRDYMEALELTILRGNLSDVKIFIATHSVPRWLSKLCIKLIMRFAKTPLLAHLEANHKDLFWATFGHTFLPDKASSVFGRPEILEFWRTSPSFLTKEYSNEALDGASRAGFVHVLDWWARSGLPLKFTEAALEQASGQGHLAVLEWWKQLLQQRQQRSLSPLPQNTASSFSNDLADWRRGSNDDDDNHNNNHSSGSINPIHPSSTTPSFRLKPGKSICYATQNGHVDAVRWWLDSGIAFPHEDTVAKLASTHGHVAILRVWHERKGSKMIFDNQVLVGATKNGNVRVLEWWKRCGLKVEYKTCDIEEALEDGDEGERGLAVRRWWAQNGLNLGVGPSEWMEVKVLTSSN